MSDGDTYTGGMEPFRPPRCDKRSCKRPVKVYVDKVGQDLCEEHGSRWSDDEKIPVKGRMPWETEGRHD